MHAGSKGITILQDELNLGEKKHAEQSWQSARIDYTNFLRKKDDNPPQKSFKVR